MNSKTIGIIVVIIIVVVGLWLMLKKPSAETTPNATAPTTATQTAQQAPAEDPNVTGIKASGTSNAALNQDAAAIDAQLKGLATDNAAAQQ